MPNFAACDLCYSSLWARLIEIQISPAMLVQLSEEGDVVHRARGLNGLRDYRLCEGCGSFLLEVLRAMSAATRGAA